MWQELAGSTTGNVNSIGLDVTCTIPAGSSCVKIVPGIFAQRISHPAVGTQTTPTYGNLHIQGQVGSGPKRTLRRSLVRPHAVVSTYVPSGTVNTYWWSQETWGTQDMDGPYEVAIGGSGQAAVYVRVIFTVFTAPSISVSEIVYYAYDLRFLQHTP